MPCPVGPEGRFRPGTAGPFTSDVSPDCIANLLCRVAERLGRGSRTHRISRQVLKAKRILPHGPNLLACEDF